MLSTSVASKLRTTVQRNFTPEQCRQFASVVNAAPQVNSARNHKVVVVGGGAAGLTISHKLLRTGKFKQDDIAVIDPATWHHYQPGWTLVGAGLKSRDELRRPLQSLIDPKLKFYADEVANFMPEENSITLGGSSKITYDQLVVVPGIKVDFSSIKGLSEAVKDPQAPVSSTYSYETCAKVSEMIDRTNKGKALFTQPAGIVKCAGAPQKIMWLALDIWKRAGLYNPADPSKSPIQLSFATALPGMFGVPKYSKRLNELREERGVEALFQHDLTAIEGNTATFTRLDNKEQVKRDFDFLHVVPKMGPHAFVKNSPLADAAGLVDVDSATTQHKKYPNVWSVGDASSLPTSKTAAAITAQAPVLVENLLKSMNGASPTGAYTGYTSCPLTTEIGKVMLAEFKYQGEPAETFGNWFGIDQATPRRAFYHLKKDFFPWVYYNSMVKGTWAGPKGWTS